MPYHKEGGGGPSAEESMGVRRRFKAGPRITDTQKVYHQVEEEPTPST